MSSFKRYLYIFYRGWLHILTYRCINCGEEVASKCLCDECIKELVPSENGEHFAYYYSGAAKKAMLRFKFGNPYEYLYDIFCEWLLDTYEKFEQKDFDAVVPVPSFDNPNNTVYGLAKRFSILTELEFDPDLLKKIRKTEKQHRLNLENRRKNLAGAFSASPDVKGKSILLIDDIMTSGSTLAECSKTLLAAGAKNVTVLTVLKTDYHRI